LNWIGVLVSFLHLFATVVWIGGVMFRVIVLGPVMDRYRELGPTAFRLIVDVAKRFNGLVWGSIVVLLLTGLPMTVNNARFPGFVDLSNVWSTAIFVKHVMYLIMAVLFFVQTVAISKMNQVIQKAPTRAASEQYLPFKPSFEMVKLKRRQLAFGMAILILGILTLLLTAIAELA